MNEFWIWLAIYFGCGLTIMVYLWWHMFRELPKCREEWLICAVLGMVFPFLPVAIVLGRIASLTSDEGDEDKDDRL